MVLFGALMVVFVVVTVQHFGQREYVTDNVEGLPPVYVVTALLVPFCAAFVAGFWMLFFDSFKQRGGPAQEQPAISGTLPQLVEATPTRRERLGGWFRAHRPHPPRGTD